MSELPPGGIYLVEIRLAEAQTLTVGRLGEHHFAAGPYLYVGSALRNLAHRLARHARPHRVLRWHVDSLTCRGRVARILVWTPQPELEHRIARELAGRLPVVSRFGSSDCRCPGHLFPGDCDQALRAVSLRPILDLSLPE